MLPLAISLRMSVLYTELVGAEPQDTDAALCLNFVAPKRTFKLVAKLS